MRIIWKIADRLGLSDNVVENLMDWAEAIAPMNATEAAVNELRNLELAQSSGAEYTANTPLLAVA